jgi:hypothetical protein
MKSLIALLFLINCLAFFMFSHIQKQSELQSDQAEKEQSQPLDSPQPVVLLSELSADQLKELNPDAVELAEPKDKPLVEDADISE